MDNGWAVVLGAIIALAGSALIPWFRDSQVRKVEQARTDALRIDDALISFLASNTAVGTADAFEDQAVFMVAMEARSRAAAALILTVPHDERTDLSVFIDNTVPSRAASDLPPRVAMVAVQLTLLNWVASGDPTSELWPRFEANVSVAQERLRYKKKS